MTYIYKHMNKKKNQVLDFIFLMKTTELLKNHVINTLTFYKH